MHGWETQGFPLLICAMCDNPPRLPCCGGKMVAVFNSSNFSLSAKAVYTTCQGQWISLCYSWQHSILMWVCVHMLTPEYNVQSYGAPRPKKNITELNQWVMSVDIVSLQAKCISYCYKSWHIDATAVCSIWIINIICTGVVLWPKSI